MRKYLGLAVLTGALVAGACGTKSSGGAGVRDTNGRGAGAAAGAGSGFNGGANAPGGPVFNPDEPNGNGGAPSDPEPGNAHVTHPDCQAGMCLDFPAAPIMGEGVALNSPNPLWGKAK